MMHLIGPTVQVFDFLRCRYRLHHSHQRLQLNLHSLLQSLSSTVTSPPSPSPPSQGKDGRALSPADALAAAMSALAQADEGRDALRWTEGSEVAAVCFNEDVSVRPWWDPQADGRGVRLRPHACGEGGE